jgi:hypothetical protein
MALAYISGQFVNLTAGQAHYAFSRDTHVHPVAPPEPHIELLVGVDFNVNPMTAAIGYRKEIDGEMHYFFFTEYYIRNSNTFMLADLLAEDFGSRVVTCYPDPTGESRKTSSDRSDIEILQKKGFNMRYRHGVTQRRSLNVANGAFSHNRIHIDPSCKHLINDLEQVVTDDYGNILKPNGTMLTHISDAMRNVLMVDAIVREEQKHWRVA